MTHYALHQRCWPTGSLRAREIQAFLMLLESSCAVSAFELAGEGTLTPTADALDPILRRALAAAPFPGAGADEDIFARLDAGDEYLRVSIHSGTKPGEPFIDYYDVDFGSGGVCLSVDAFRQALQIFRPFEAFIAELNNEADLDAYSREQQVGFFTAPALIRGLHYFNRDLAAAIGGIEHCLRAPVGQAQLFLDGVLLQLVDGRFDPTNPEHLKRQREVMTYFGMKPVSDAPTGVKP